MYNKCGKNYHNLSPTYLTRQVVLPTDICGPESVYEEYYKTKKYFKGQSKEQFLQANRSSRTRFGKIKPQHTVLEVGCSTGTVLNTIRCAKKYCVEINEHARNYAKKMYNITTFRCVAELPDESVDYAYMLSVLEHVESPLVLLRELYKKMRSNSILEIQVRNEGFQSASEYKALQSWSQKERDTKNHIYTWTELSLGNMVEAAGFKIFEITSTIAAFPSNYSKLRSSMTSEQWEKTLSAEGIKQGVQSLKAFAKKV